MASCDLAIASKPPSALTYSAHAGEHPLLSARASVVRRGAVPAMLYEVVDAVPCRDPVGHDSTG
eukprot:6185883-Pleurochrysis_carterae.AAC.2